MRKHIDLHLEGPDMTTPIARNRFGPVIGVREGQIFENRMALSLAGVHAPTQNGISGTQIAGCDSIVLNGAYRDEDHGDLIIYSGENPRGGSDNDDQLLVGGNLALKVSLDNGLPVRVTRGSKTVGGPSSGYRYDGLYQVVRISPNREEGRIVWRYRLEKLYRPLPADVEEPGATERRLVMSERIVRDANLAARIKKLYGFSCQVCGESLPSPDGPYAEAAHIRPLGAPDDGPDVEENLLCLCPNHHKLLDNGGLVVDNDWGVRLVVGDRTIGTLTLKPRHRLTQDYLRWHRERWLAL